MKSEHKPIPPVLAAGETVLWQGRPLRSAFILQWILELFPILAGFSLFGYFFFFFQGFDPGLKFYAFLFLAVIGILLFQILTLGRRWRNTYYYLTSRRILVQKGLKEPVSSSLFYKDIRDFQIYNTLMDKAFGTCSVLFNLREHKSDNSVLTMPFSLLNLELGYEVYERVERILEEMKHAQEQADRCHPFQ